MTVCPAGKKALTGQYAQNAARPKSLMHELMPGQSGEENGKEKGLHVCVCAAEL